ncbi:MAG TPA: transglycosylase domain-containing protein, partial [Candidatus Limnocylindrales bacterium]|nr:transglycosylase domain-containing protein [Candidatus Limnocylindrales bacterium]
MQTSLARRQRHRRNGAARRGRGGGGSARRAALAIPLLLFGSFLALGSVGFVAVVSAYAYYSRDLPDPERAFQDLAFDQPSIIYDRTGTVELARLGERKRDLVTFDQLPAELLDATTAVEDKDYWTNPGFDLGGFISATIDTLQGRPRGGSTITQQLVRARLLPEEAFEGSTYERKAREIIQSIRLTQAFPGQEGKEQIITAYLNQNFYGNQSYGVAAAAKGYFGKELADLTLAEVAILAAIPQSPSEFDLVRNAEKLCNVEVADDQECPAAEVRLVVPQDSAIVIRRNRVLELMETRSVLSGADHTLAEYEAAKSDAVVLAPQGSAPWKAAHFVWQVREQLGAILCGEENAMTCEKVDTGGYRIVTTLDWEKQQVVEKWLVAAARSPNFGNTQRTLRSLGIPESEWDWIVDLRGTEIHNGAAAVIDYRTGEVLAYAGSAGYHAVGYEKFDPQFDVLSSGEGRQPGSAIKPLNYITGL